MKAKNTTRILVLEDDDEIAKVVVERLTNEGFDVSRERDGPTGFRRALAEAWDLVILDLGLPGMRGIDICQGLREERPVLPILILTSAADEISKIVGFEMGADDYLTKPFSYNELVVRIRALLRRAGGAERAPSERRYLRVGGLEMDLDARVASVEGEEVALTAQELELLAFLASNTNRALSFDDLMQYVWGGSSGQEQAIRAQVSRLRKKLNPGDIPRRDYIRTVRGFGYKLVDPAACLAEPEQET